MSYLHHNNYRNYQKLPFNHLGHNHDRESRLIGPVPGFYEVPRPPLGNYDMLSPATCPPQPTRDDGLIHASK